MPKVKDHTHGFIRRKSKSGSIMYHCTDPDCWFVLRKDYLAGKRAICPQCLMPFILTKYSLTLKRPHCDGCTRGKEDKTKQEKAFLKQIEYLLQKEITS